MFEWRIERQVYTLRTLYFIHLGDFLLFVCRLFQFCYNVLYGFPCSFVVSSVLVHSVFLYLGVLLFSECCYQILLDMPLLVYVLFVYIYLQTYLSLIFEFEFGIKCLILKTWHSILDYYQITVVNILAPFPNECW